MQIICLQDSFTLCIAVGRLLKNNTKMISVNIMHTKTHTFEAIQKQHY